MISRRIDLTENNDFSSTELDLSFLNSGVANRALKVNSMTAMSFDDFKLIAEYEKFFGIKMHSCQAYEIFNSDLSKYRYDMQTHCHRCGAPLIPWNRYNDLCPECHRIVDEDFKGKFPWNYDEGKTYFVSRRDDPKEIFNLR